jgi:hypothetical protein
MPILYGSFEPEEESEGDPLLQAARESARAAMAAPAIIVVRRDVIGMKTFPCCEDRGSGCDPGSCIGGRNPSSGDGIRGRCSHFGDRVVASCRRYIITKI